MTNRRWNGRGYVTWSSLNFKAPNHISGIIESVIVKILTRVRADYYQVLPKGWQAYGHVMLFLLPNQQCLSTEGNV